MKIPKGMTEQEVTDQIIVVVNRIAPKYTFYGYDVNDMKSEAFIICMDALERYDESRPLENFLSVNLSNRLKNFVRDNYFTKVEAMTKGQIIRPAQLDYEHIICEEYHETDDENYSALDYKQMAEVISQNIDPSLRLDYLKMINEVYISRNKRKEIMGAIYNILRQHGYDVEAIDEEG